MPAEEQHMMDVDLGGLRRHKMPVNYPSNSKSARKPPEKPRFEKAIEGEVVKRREGIASRLGRNFVSEDAGTVVSYVVLEVLLPAAKNMIVEAGQSALERIFYGDDRPRRRGDRQSYINYQRPGEPRREPDRAASRHARANHDFTVYVLPTRIDAMTIIEKLQYAIDEFKSATVADLYDLLGQSMDFPDYKWGWTNLSEAKVKAVRDGYILDLPPTKSLA